MYINDGFVDEMSKVAVNYKAVAKALGLAGTGAAAGAGGAYVMGEKKRKKQLQQLADLFRQANMAENKVLARRYFQAGRQSR